MSASSSIQWTDSTHNFWRGCTKVSPGCAHCYAEALVTTRLGGQWGKGAPRVKSKNFNQPIRWNKQPWWCDKCQQPWAVPGLHPECDAESNDMHRRRVFSLSLGDFLDPEVPIEWLRDMLHVIFRCNRLTWQLVTKRPELFFDRLWAVLNAGVPQPMRLWLLQWLDMGMAPDNVWLITSTENQEMLQTRVLDLLKIPAAVHGLSCEPLLEDISICHLPSAINWVILGGESGPLSRPCNIDWIRRMVQKCDRLDIACFVKQLGSAIHATSAIDPIDQFPGQVQFCQGPDPLTALVKLPHKKGGDPSEWPDDLRVRQFPALS